MNRLYPAIQDYLNQLQIDVQDLSPNRKALLSEVAEYVTGRKRSGEVANLNFICTHNSRRSHLSQLWAAAAAFHFDIPEVRTFSGGTEATAFNSRAVAAMRRAGFQIDDPGGSNPCYQVSFAEGVTVKSFSKRYDATVNHSPFCAVMTCSEADAECPIVMGSAKRIGLHYEDPKVADGTPEETSRYDERCRQIATEMYYAMSLARK
ncbi:MAG: protein-tyrosine-phosphatase [Cyclobacteriaceae bacterium]|nr:protein-tyrosine-phosphatase [Cyclobacteriaceae bacterium HetDA_MAG_MS6]